MTRIGSSYGADAPRAIPIPMRRKKRSERIGRFRQSQKYRELEPLRRQAFRWALDDVDELEETDPELPDELTDRQHDCVRAFIAIADVAGGEWRPRARAAVKAAYAVVDDDTETTGVKLLTDVRSLFLTSTDVAEQSADVDGGFLPTERWSSTCAHSRSARGTRSASRRSRSRARPFPDCCAATTYGPVRRPWVPIRASAATNWPASGTRLNGTCWRFPKINP